MLQDQVLLNIVINALSNQIQGNKRLSTDTTRTPMDKQYFTGGFDSADMIARKIADSGAVDRNAFLIACGCIP